MGRRMPEAPKEHITPRHHGHREQPNPGLRATDGRLRKTEKPRGGGRAELPVAGSGCQPSPGPSARFAPSAPALRAAPCAAPEGFMRPSEFVVGHGRAVARRRLRRARSSPVPGANCARRDGFALPPYARGVSDRIGWSPKFVRSSFSLLFSSPSLASLGCLWDGRVPEH